MKNYKYFCFQCKTSKSPKIEKKDNPNSTVPLDTEVVIDVKKEKDGHEYVFKIRQLECGHMIRASDPAFIDYETDSLSDQETQIIRRQIEKDMLGKSQQEIEAHILSWCEQYNALLKFHSKGKQQAKYGIQYLDQLRERVAEQLNEKEKQAFEMKFAHFLDIKPTTQKTIERERNSTNKTVDKQKLALEKARALLAGSGIKTRFDTEKYTVSDASTPGIAKVTFESEKGE